MIYRSLYSQLYFRCNIILTLLHKIILVQIHEAIKFLPVQFNYIIISMCLCFVISFNVPWGYLVVQNLG